MNYNHGALFVIATFTVGAFAGQWAFWKLTNSRRKQLRKQSASMPRPKPEPQSIEFNMVLSGVDDVEAGLERVEAALSRIAEAADGVPVTVNNYYNMQESEEE